jgi:DNA-nicking Smr family endonuclease
MAKINNTIQIDIHGMTVDEALKLLREQMKTAPRWIEKIVVVHGYNRGTALKEAIPKLRSPRIKEIAPSFLNDGETIIWLRC